MLSVFDVAAVKVKEANPQAVVENFLNIVDTVVIDDGDEGGGESLCKRCGNTLSAGVVGGMMNECFEAVTCGVVWLTNLGKLRGVFVED